jgi:polyferredoxin
MKRRAWLRTALQATFVLLALLLGLRHRWEGTSFDRACPFGGVETLWAAVRDGTFLQETGGSNLVLLGLLLVAALLTGRAFCGWVCPLGAVQEWLARLARRLTGGRAAWLPVRPPPRLDRALRWLKYAVLAWVIWASASAVLPPLIPFCPYRTLFTFNAGSLIGWSVLVALALLSLVVDRFWCRYLCPLGAILAPFNALSLWRIRFDAERCASCARCDRACPLDLDVVREVERGGECVRCMDCVRACPREGALRG